MTQELIERLRRKTLVLAKLGRPFGEKTRSMLVNPDGPQAADALQSQSARIAEQDAMLRAVRPYIEAFRLKEAGAALMGETDRMPIRELCKRIDAYLTKDSTSVTG